MTHNRILIVDDLPDMLVTLHGMLSDFGYDVLCASSRAEALNLLAREHFSVAVLDVRLDETDEDNTEGLLLMYEIRAHDPGIAVVILTGHADVRMVQEARQPGDDGRAPAFAFLVKEKDILELPKMVERAQRFHMRSVSAPRAVPSMHIMDKREYFSSAVRNIRLMQENQPSSGQLEAEAEELLTKLFQGSEGIDVYPLKRNNRWANVFKVVPWLPDDRLGEAVFAKLDNPETIDEEYKKFTDLAFRIVGNRRLPVSLGHQSTRSLAGIMYTFMKIGKTRDFGEFFQAARAETAMDCLDNLFTNTCFHRAFGSKVQCRPVDLAAFYLGHLRLSPACFQEAVDALAGDGEQPAFSRAADGDLALANFPGCRLPDPVAVFNRLSFHDTCPVADIHGNLTGDTVLVDDHNETWLIDFENTTNGPVMQDYAAFELYLRVFQTGFTRFADILRWEQNLDKGLCFLPTSPAGSTFFPAGHDKAYQAVIKIRSVANKQFVEGASKSYLAGLFFNALKLTTITDLPELQREHALLCAAQAGQRLLAIS